MALELKGPDITSQEMISPRVTCQGEDISPVLTWSGVPPQTESFAIICDDPDAHLCTWVHWVIYNIPKDKTMLTEGLPPVETLSDGTKQGYNGFHRIGYNGPCPPGTKPHRYFFKLYALDTKLNIPGTVTKDVLLKAMEGHILAQTEIVGKFKR